MRVSVVIPCYNRAAVVAETIRCVIRQTLPPDEIIAVDDGSTDETVKVLESFGSQVRVLGQPNAGPSAARNAGLAAAKGEFVWFMDSDDLASLNKLEVQVRALEQSGADIAVAPWIKCRLNGSRANAETHVLQQRGLPGQLPLALPSRWTIVVQTALFRRSLLNKVGGFDSTYLVAEDQIFFLKCLLADAKLVHTPECLVVYRSNGSNKLTEDGSSLERRFVDWARYLLEARQLCMRFGKGDPLDWFSYRLRLWVAWRDLAVCRSPVARETSDQVAAVLGTSSHRSLYAMAEKGLQWLGGCRQRAFGDRSPMTLRAGSQTPHQISLLAELGYSLGSL